MSTAGPSVSQIAALMQDQCDGNVVAFHFAPDHETRTLALEGILEYSYDSLIEDSHLNQAQSEDELSVQIVRQLKCHSIEANHDTQTRGHRDIHVRGKDHFLWIGEAKIHKDYEWLNKGFKQLSTRYATGAYGQDRGEIIIYCRTQRPTETLATWRDRLTELHPEVTVYDDQIPTRSWFRSKHHCKTSGTLFHIRHRILGMNWKPDA